MRYPTPTEWLKLVEEFRAGELTMKEFIAKHDVSFNTAQYWVYRKAKRVQFESKPETKFLPVTVVASCASADNAMKMHNPPISASAAMTTQNGTKPSGGCIDSLGS